jgi:DNA polymerase-3 subunit epsilon
MIPVDPNGPIVAIDLETTGLFAESDRVVEVGALRFGVDGRESGRFERLVKPGRPMSPGAERIHGISDAMLINADPASVVLPEFLDWLREIPPRRLLAHHARFDAGFLGREFARAGLPMPAVGITDTLAMARRRLPDAPSHQLEVIAGMLGVDAGPSHRALADCIRVRALWLAVDGESGPHVIYPVFDPTREQPVPSGWEPLALAISGGLRVRIRYEGGSRGAGPREITPRRLIHKGGAAYIVALCHLEGFEKAFRLDRVAAFEVIGAVSTVG